MPPQGQKETRQAALISASPSQIARKIRPSATIGTATKSLANVSKLGHLAAHCVFRQLALNVVKSRLPGANQPRNHEAVVLDEIQGSAAAQTPWQMLSIRLRHRASPARRRSKVVGAKPHAPNMSQTKAAARFERTAATQRRVRGAQLCGVGGGGGDAERERRSAMNWSNSVLSRAKRSRSRNSLNSRCSSSRRRKVSVRYSSKA
jgi:hypothetical protein